MKYLRILLACAAEPWAMQREKLEIITQFLLLKANGGGVEPVLIDTYSRTLTARRDELIANAPGNVAVITVYGSIMQRASLMSEFSGGTSVEAIMGDFRAALANPEIKAIIMDFDSPGGGVFGIQEAAQEIFDSRGIKPIIAVVNSLCASAAFWMACACDEIVVTPGGQAGSIGVYSVHEDISRYLDAEGISSTLIYSGKYKTEGNQFQPLSDEAKAHMQERVDLTAARFTNDVARGRGITSKLVNDEFGQGRMFGANELIRRGMADRVGTFDETLERFGSSVRPSVSRQVAVKAAAAEHLVTILAGGERPTIRELEKGFKGLGLSRSQAERAVRILLPKDQTAQGEPEKPSDGSARERDPGVAMALANFRKGLAGFKVPKIGAKPNGRA